MVTKDFTRCFSRKQKQLIHLFFFIFIESGKLCHSSKIIDALQILSTDTGYSLENLPEAIDDKDEWQERVWEIYASRMT